MSGGGTRTGRRAKAGVAVLMALSLLAAACGSRRSTDEIAAAAGAGPNRVAAAGAEQAAGDAVPAAGDSGEGPAVEAGARPDGAPGAAAGSGPARAGAAASDTRGPTRAAAGAASRSPGPVASGTPVRVGVVGTMSGVGGTQLGSTRAIQAWAQARNQAGGLNGHPVEVLVVDDGGDPARFRSALQDLVERRGVVAFVGALSGFTLTDGAVKYLEDKRVPVVGGDRLSALWNTSPMLFPQASAGDAVIWNHAVNTLRIAGKGAPVGWVTCQEAQICRDADRLWQQYAPALGLDVKYRATVSVAQPSFTAECVRAMQAGVKVFLLGTDANSTRRIATDCSRQGFAPRYGVLQTSDEMAAEPALDGGFFGSATFPWVAADSAATRAFQEAMARYAPGVVLSAHASSGWTAAKLFEAAAARIGDQPSAAQVLEGLWALRDETLGGLAAPITFARDKGAPPSYCFFPMEIRGRAWVASPKELVCRAP